jgi:hypothetical protein
VDYVLTEHAKDALEKRQIRTAWLEQALTSPEVTEADPVDADLEHRLARIREFGDRVLRVIVNRKRTPLSVITVFFDLRRTIP